MTTLESHLPISLRTTSWVFVSLKFLTKIQVLGTTAQRDEQAAGRGGYIEIGQSHQSLSEVQKIMCLMFIPIKAN